MSILKFTFPSDSKILQDIDNNNLDVKFIGPASVIQNIKETIFTRIVQFDDESGAKKVIYKKRGISWGFVALETINL